MPLRALRCQFDFRSFRGSAFQFAVLFISYHISTYFISLLPGVTSRWQSWAHCNTWGQHLSVPMWHIVSISLPSQAVLCFPRTLCYLHGQQWLLTPSSMLCGDRLPSLGSGTLSGQQPRWHCSLRRREAPRKPRTQPEGCSWLTGSHPAGSGFRAGLLRQLHGGGTSPLGQLERKAIRFYSGDPIFFLLHQINTSVTPLTTRELLLIWKSDASDFLACACGYFTQRSKDGHRMYLQKPFLYMVWGELLFSPPHLK